MAFCAMRCNCCDLEFGLGKDDMRKKGVLLTRYLKFLGFGILGALFVFAAVSVVIVSFEFSKAFHGFLGDLDRRAACHFSSSVRLGIGRMEVELPAELMSSFETLGAEGGRAIQAELAIPEEHENRGILAFCLEEPQSAPIPVASFTFGFRSPLEGYAKELGVREGFFQVGVRDGTQLFGVGKAGTTFDETSSLIEKQARRVRTEVVNLAGNGRAIDGFRGNAHCEYQSFSFDPKQPSRIDTTRPLWKCSLEISDDLTGVTYVIGGLDFQRDQIDPDEVRETSLKVARKLREFLEAMAPKNPLSQASQQDL